MRSIIDDVNNTEIAEKHSSTGTWTVGRLRSLLNRHHIPYTATHNDTFGEILRLDRCFFCHESEGAPAVGIGPHGWPFYRCLRANKCGADSFREFENRLSAPPLRILNTADLLREYPDMRDFVIKDLLRYGDIMGVVADTKSRKSWWSEQLALCVATGKPFLGFETVRGRVLIVDNELRGDLLSHRLPRIADALDIKYPCANLDVLPLREQGKVDVGGLRAFLQAVEDRYALIVCDAMYKFYPAATDENSNANMTSVVAQFEAITRESGAALVLIHHTSKGNQHGKKVTDVGSGAGAFSRATDVHAVMRNHEAPNTVVLECEARGVPPVEPVCLTFDFPLWTVSDYDPQQTSARSQKPLPSLDEYLVCVPEKPAPLDAIRQLAHAKLGCSRDSLRALEAEAIDRAAVLVTRPKSNGPKYIQLA